MLSENIIESVLIIRSVMVRVPVELAAEKAKEAGLVSTPKKLGNWLRYQIDGPSEVLHVVFQRHCLYLSKKGQ